MLADFGLSTTIDKRENEAPTITDIRVQCSLPFSPQELVNDTAYYDRGIRSKTTATDVYAYGMLVLEVATSVPPSSPYLLTRPGIHRKRAVGDGDEPGADVHLHHARAEASTPRPGLPRRAARAGRHNVELVLAMLGVQPHGAAAHVRHRRPLRWTAAAAAGRDA